MYSPGSPQDVSELLCWSSDCDSDDSHRPRRNASPQPAAVVTAVAAAGELSQLTAPWVPVLAAVPTPAATAAAVVAAAAAGATSVNTGAKRVRRDFTTLFLPPFPPPPPPKAACDIPYGPRTDLVSCDRTPCEWEKAYNVKRLQLNAFLSGAKQERWDSRASTETIAALRRELAATKRDVGERVKQGVAAAQAALTARELVFEQKNKVFEAVREAERHKAHLEGQLKATLEKQSKGRQHNAFAYHRRINGPN